MENLEKFEIETKDIFVGGDLHPTNQGSTCGDEDIWDDVNDRYIFLCE